MFQTVRNGSLTELSAKKKIKKKKKKNYSSKKRLDE